MKRALHIETANKMCSHLDNGTGRYSVFINKFAIKNLTPTVAILNSG